ncbi:MAG: glycosyltransferase family 4 protein [Candidatus Sumerlaeia bacterium]|nr:glycosyltransferase family 4 protein [Candidatus Sumerlaeia bacterium]
MIGPAHAPSRTDTGTDRAPLSPAYLLSRFPQLTETFVLREIEFLERQGCQPIVLSLQRPLASEPVESRWQGPAARRVFYAPAPWAPATLLAHVRLLVSHPVVYATTLARIVALAWNRPRMLAEALFVFAVAVAWLPVLRRAGCNLLHAHFAGAPTTAAWVLARLSGIPFGFTAHANDIFVDAYALRDKLVDAAYVMTVTEYNRRHLGELAPEAREKIDVMPAGIETASIEWKAPSGERSRRPLRLLAVGRLVEKKGFRYLIDALALLRDRGVPVQCLVVGNGRLDGALKAQARVLGLRGIVRFLGPRAPETVERLMRRADAFVLPCIVADNGDRDGLPHSIMEAMALGVPVVTTTAVGIPELVEDGVSGLLVPERDARALADAIERLHREPTLAPTLAGPARARVEQQCDLARLAPELLRRMNSAIRNPTSRIPRRASALVVAGLLAVSCLHAAGEEVVVFPPANQWRPYHNFGKAFPVENWKATIGADRMVVTGSQRQPQARVGVRSLPITLPADDSMATVRLRGHDVARSGAYAILVDSGDRALRQIEWVGPGGTFELDVELPVTIQPEDKSHAPSLILYVFHDGQGRLEVDSVSVCALTAERVGSPAGRRGKAIGHTLTLAPSGVALPFPAQVGSLLPGERRHRLLGADEVLAPQSAGLAIVERPIALSWEMAVARHTPFWLTPSSESRSASVVVEDRSSESGPDALPPFPADRHAYVYYYGSYRFDKKAPNRERDRSSLQAVRAAGFTGVGFWDDYGLDFHRWKEGKALDATYLLEMSRLYGELGFRSPMMYSVFAGLDRGRVGWTSGDADEMRGYLIALRPHLEQARAILGETPLWVHAVDEPDDATRQDLAVRMAPLWADVMGEPMVVTANWHTARRLAGQARLLVGAGDYPSAEAFAETGVVGIYTSADAVAPPLRHRLVAGLHAWACGASAQAWWHWNAVAGSLESDLDGHAPDFILAHPDSIESTVALSQVAEGLQDWRLLLALESLVAGGRDEDGRIGAYLTGLRGRVPHGDRLAAPWDTGDSFSQELETARQLWRDHVGRQ